MNHLVLIADLVSSRATTARKALQDQLRMTLKDRNDNSSTLTSPYTLTLGDEFQAVFNRADEVFADMLAIHAALHPVGVRFSFAVGAITTELNRQQALGMDGPAFYEARDGMSQLKESGDLCHVAGLADDQQALAAGALQVLSHLMEKWHANRFVILALLIRGWKVDAIADELGISEQGVYKNIHSGGLEAVRALLVALTDAMNAALETSWEH